MISATPEDKNRLLGAVKRCQQDGVSLNGLFYYLQPREHGKPHFEIIVPEGTPNPTVERAIRAAWDTDATATFTCIRVPLDWLDKPDL